jgi:hypothetical protein
MKISTAFRSALTGAALLTLAACGGGGSESTPGGIASPSGPGSGTLRLALTDAPGCDYKAVNIKVEKVRVHQSSTAGDADAGWHELAVPPTSPQPVDLLTLTNGLLQELGQLPLPAGRYTQLRLVLAESGNSLKLADGAVVPLTTPSGQQSGIKVNVDIAVAADRMADFVLDFDACKSVVVAGRSGKYLLKPQLTVIPRYVNGVLGYVDASLANGAVTASLQQGGVVVRATPTDGTGRFLLQPVPPGSYTLVLTGYGRTTMVVNGVPVVPQTVTEVNSTTTRLLPPLSQTGTLEGLVGTGTVPVVAAVRVLQTLATGTVEVAGAPVNGDTGLYRHGVPVAAPLVGSYVAMPATVGFAPDPSAAARYGLEATDYATVKPAGPFVLTAGGTLTNNFSFP